MSRLKITQNLENEEPNRWQNIEAAINDKKAYENDAFQQRKVLFCSVENSAEPPLLERRRLASNKSEKTYICRFCTIDVVEYRTKEALRQHIRFFHRILKPPICPVNGCNFTAKKDHWLTGHLRRVHPDEDFRCQVCEKTFGTNRARNRHEKGHKSAGVPCANCGQLIKSSMKRHVEVVHQGIRRFRCQFCQRLFATNSTKFKAHLEKHLRNQPANHVVCVVCKRQNKEKFTFARGKEIRRHIRACHDGQLPLSCPAVGCRLSTNHKSNLKVHMNDVALVNGELRHTKKRLR